MRRNLQRCFLLLLACAVAAPVWAQRGALTVPNNLGQLTSRAAVILRGSVIDARVEKHPQFSALDTLVVTLRVKETLKGETTDTFTFRQYLWDFQDRRSAAGYLEGQDLLLLMNAPSRYGLSSPTGLIQGRFRITRDQSGREIAVNGYGNAMLFDGLSAEVAKKATPLSPSSASLVLKHRKGPISVRDLTALIHELVQDAQ